MGMTEDAASETRVPSAPEDANPPDDFTQFIPDLQGRWTGLFRILQLASTGRFAGMVRLSLDGIERGVLVITNQPSQDAAMARVNIRTRQFVKAWGVRPRA